MSNKPLHLGTTYKVPQDSRTPEQRKADFDKLWADHAAKVAEDHARNMKLKPLVISHETVKQPPAAYPQFNINTTNIANATMPTAVHPPALHVAPPVIRETLLSDTNIQTQVPTYNINNVIYPHNTIVPGPICDAPYELDTPALETNI